MPVSGLLSNWVSSARWLQEKELMLRSKNWLLPMEPIPSSSVSRLMYSMERALLKISSFRLAVRIMRVIVALGLCAEARVEEYQANSKTPIMTMPQGIASFKAW